MFYLKYTKIEIISHIYQSNIEMVAEIILRLDSSNIIKHSFAANPLI